MDGSPAASIADLVSGAMVAREMAASTGKKLVIVESPAKAKTIAGYLGKDYVVESSIGHIRDLPNSASEIPAKFKGEAWARLGVDVDHDFQPLYVVDAGKKKVVSELKAKLKDADELLLATDEDREGEAIAWHLREVLEPKVPVRRMVFHEITKHGDRARARRDPRHRRPARRRAGDAAHPRPALRVRGLARPLAEDHAGPFCRTRAVRRDASRRGARARADEVRRRRLLGRRRRLRSRLVRRAPHGGRRQARRTGPRLRPRRQAAHADARAARRVRGPRARGRVGRRQLPRRLRRGEAVHAPPGRAVHDLDAAAGGEPQAALLVAADDAHRPAAVRERLHHLHAHRLDDAVGVGARRGARPGARAVRRGLVPAQPRLYNRKVKNAQEAHEAIRPAGDRFRTPDEVRRELDRGRVQRSTT